MSDTLKKLADYVTHLRDWTATDDQAVEIAAQVITIWQETGVLKTAWFIDGKIIYSEGPP